MVVFSSLCAHVYLMSFSKGEARARGRVAKEGQSGEPWHNRQIWNRCFSVCCQAGAFCAFLEYKPKY